MFLFPILQASPVSSGDDRFMAVGALYRLLKMLSTPSAWPGDFALDIALDIVLGFALGFVLGFALERGILPSRRPGSFV